MGKCSGYNRKWFKETSEIANEKLVISSEKIKKEIEYTIPRNHNPIFLIF